MKRERTGHPFCMTTRHGLLVASCIFFIACGGRIAPERGDGDTEATDTQAPEPVTPEPAAKSASTAVPTPAQYCDALRENACNGSMVSDASCADSYAAASDAYRAALVDCVQGGEVDCNAYPGTCEVGKLAAATPTAAQRALAEAFCHACVADEPASDCVDVTLRNVGLGETIGVAILVLSDSGAVDGLSCAPDTRAMNQPTPFLCEGEFINCLAKYRPIVGQ